MELEEQLGQLEFEIESCWNAKEIFRATNQPDKVNKMNDDLITLQAQYKMITGKYYRPEMMGVDV